MTRSLALDDLYRLREASDPQPAPDSSRVAFVVTRADADTDGSVRSIWTVATAGGDPVEITRGPSDASPRWSPDASTLAFLRASGGPPQIWLLPSSGEAHQLTKLPLGVSSFKWSPDGKKIAAFAAVDLEGTPEDDAEKAKRAAAPIVVDSAMYKSDGAGLLRTMRSHLFVIDASTGEATQLTDGDMFVSALNWSSDSKKIAFSATTSDRAETSRSHVFAIDAKGGKPKEIAMWDGTGSCPAFEAGDKTILFTGALNAGAGHGRLYRVDAKGGEPQLLMPTFDRNVMLGGPAYPGAEPELLDDGRIVFCARDRGCTNAYILDGDEPRKIVGDGTSVVSGLNLAGGVLAFVFSTPDVPADIYIADPDGSNQRRLTTLNDWLDDVELHAKTDRVFTAPDGVEVHGWLMRGKGEGKQPLLVDIHGGPHNAWSPVFDSAHLYHEVLASQGWSILTLNPRGSDGYGEKFFTAVVGAWGEVDTDDFLSPIDDVVAEGLVDPRRIAVCGYSYGGHMTNWLTSHTDRFAAAVSGGCLANITSFYGTSDLGYWLGQFEMGGEAYDLRDRYAELSPITYVENVTTPTLILHGENDDRCPIGQAEEWFTSLKRLGVKTQLVRYPGASHLFIVAGRPTHRIDYNQRIIDWVTTHT